MGSWFASMVYSLQRQIHDEVTYLELRLDAQESSALDIRLGDGDPSGQGGHEGPAKHRSGLAVYLSTPPRARPY